MRGAVSGCYSPARAAGVGAEGGEGFDVMDEHSKNSKIALEVERSFSGE